MSSLRVATGTLPREDYKGAELALIWEKHEGFLVKTVGATNGYTYYHIETKSYATLPAALRRFSKVMSEAWSARPSE